MKKLFCLICLVAFTGSAQTLPSTAWSRQFLRATNGTQAGALLGVTNGTLTSVTLSNQVDEIWMGDIGLLTTNKLSSQAKGLVILTTNTPPAHFPYLGFSTNRNLSLSEGPVVGCQFEHGGTGPEIVITSPGPISLNPCYNSGHQAGGGIQVGSSGPYNDSVWIQYNDDPKNGHPGSLGRSKLFQFISRYLSGTNNAVAKTWAIRQESLNTSGDSALVFYSQSPTFTKVASTYGTNATESDGTMLLRLTNGVATVMGSLRATNGLILNAASQFETGGRWGKDFTLAGENVAGPMYATRQATGVGLDIASGQNWALNVGADFNVATRTEGAEKHFYFTGTPYYSSNGFNAVMKYEAGANSTMLRIGGANSSLLNAATAIQFVTGVGTTNKIGTQRMLINSNGVAVSGTVTASAFVGNGAGLTNISGTAGSRQTNSFIFGATGTGAIAAGSGLHFGLSGGAGNSSSGWVRMPVDSAMWLDSISAYCNRPSPGTNFYLTIYTNGIATDKTLIIPGGTQTKTNIGLTLPAGSYVSLFLTHNVSNSVNGDLCFWSITASQP